ncbi:20729_t:CDS:1, partial [Racocetra persica]
NASYCKSENLVFVNKFVNEHNHPLQNQDPLQEFSPALRRISDDIMNEIKFYVQECQLEATVLKKILRKKYQHQDIYRQDLYNTIHKFKA